MGWFWQAVRHKYAAFDGRARRAEYWFFVLWYSVIYLALLQVDMVLLRDTSNVPLGAGPLSGFFAFATFLPAAAVTVRRLHDTGRSGWWALVGLVPLIGDIALIVFAAQDGQHGPNRYGTDPKEQKPAPSAIGPP